MRNATLNCLKKSKIRHYVAEGVFEVSVKKGTENICSENKQIAFIPWSNYHAFWDVLHDDEYPAG